MLGGKLRIQVIQDLESQILMADGHVIGICLPSIVKPSFERLLARQLRFWKQTGWGRVHCPHLLRPCLVQAPPNSPTLALVMGVVPLVAAIWTVRGLSEGCARI